MTSRNQFHHYCQRTVRDESLLSVCFCDHAHPVSSPRHQPSWSTPVAATLTTRSSNGSAVNDVIVDSSTLCDSTSFLGNRACKAVSVGDVSNRVELLSGCIRRDLNTVDNMVRAIDTKLNDLKLYLDLIEKQETSRRLQESRLENTVQLDQIIEKCDHMLQRLNYIETKIKSIADEKDCKIFDDKKAATPKGLRRLGSLFVKRSGSSSVSPGSKESKVVPNESMLVQCKPVENVTRNEPRRSSGLLSNQKIQANPSVSNPPKLPNVQQSKVQAIKKTSTEDSLEPYRARLRDTKVMHALRVYLSFLHNQPTSSVCFDGMTNTSARMFLALEGFPIDSSEQLKEIFLKMHESNGISRECALADLATYKSYIATERIQRLQRARETTDKFYGRNCSKPK